MFSLSLARSHPGTGHSWKCSNYSSYVSSPQRTSARSVRPITPDLVSEKWLHDAWWLIWKTTGEKKSECAPMEERSWLATMTWKEENLHPALVLILYFTQWGQCDLTVCSFNFKNPNESDKMHKSLDCCILIFLIFLLPCSGKTNISDQSDKVLCNPITSRTQAAL